MFKIILLPNDWFSKPRPENYISTTTRERRLSPDLWEVLAWDRSVDLDYIGSIITFPGRGVTCEKIFGIKPVSLHCSSEK